LLQTGKILKEYRILANNIKISIDGDAVADTLSIVDAAKYLVVEYLEFYDWHLCVIVPKIAIAT
jgi:hypothetical protein